MKNVCVCTTYRLCVFGNSPSLRGGQNQVFKKNGENLLITGTEGRKGHRRAGGAGQSGVVRSQWERYEGGLQRGAGSASHRAMSTPTHGYRYDCITCTVDVNMLEINYTSINF